MGIHLPYLGALRLNSFMLEEKFEMDITEMQYTVIIYLTKKAYHNSTELQRKDLVLQRHIMVLVSLMALSTHIKLSRCIRLFRIRVVVGVLYKGLD